MWTTINAFLKTVDNFVWGVPLMVLILCGGILLTVRLGVLQIRRLPLALKWMIKNEEGGKGEISVRETLSVWQLRYAQAARGHCSG